MSVDLYEELARAAPEPTRELDVAAVQARAGQLRRRRTTGAAVTAVLLVAVAAVGLVGVTEGSSPPVVGPAPSEGVRPAQGAWQPVPYGQRLALPDNAWGSDEVGSLDPSRADAWTPDAMSVLAAAGDDLFNDVDRAVGPDGAMLLVPRRHGDDRARVVAVAADGTQQVTALPGQPDHTEVVWSPDGAWLALSTSSEGAATIHRLTPQGQVVTSTPITNFVPSAWEGSLHVHDGEVWIGWGGDEASATPVSQAARVTDDGGTTIVDELTWTTEQIGATAPLEATGMGLVPSRPDVLPRLGTTDDRAVRVLHDRGEAVVDAGLPDGAQHLVTLAARDDDGWKLTDGMMQGATQQQRYATVLLADDDRVWATGVPAAPRAAAVHVDPDGQPWFLALTSDGYELTDLTPPTEKTGTSNDQGTAATDPTPRQCDATQDSILDVAGEPGWRAYADYQPWTDTRGCLIRIDVLADRPGPAHCGFEDTRVIITGRSYGERYTTGADGVEYIKDPAGAYGDQQLADAYRADSPLPPDAVDAGARLRRTALWLDPDGEFIFLVGPQDIQWLPRGSATPCA